MGNNTLATEKVKIVYVTAHASKSQSLKINQSLSKLRYVLRVMAQDYPNVSKDLI